MKLKSIFFMCIAVMYVTSCSTRHPSEEDLVGTWEVPSLPQFSFVFSLYDYRILYKHTEFLHLSYRMEASTLYHGVEGEEMIKAGTLKFLEDATVQINSYLLPSIHLMGPIPSFLHIDHQTNQKVLTLRKHRGEGSQ